MSSTMAALGFLKLSFLFSLLTPNYYSNSNLNVGTAVKTPPSCSRIECPVYDVIDAGKDYEIRLYNSSMWMSTSSIQDISLVGATKTGFLRLFDYIQGKNDFNEKVEMTAPVMTQVSPSDGPFCESSFVVSFYVPKKNQQNPPPANGLHVQKWKNTYVAVRQFGGFVKDSDVGVEAAALAESIADTEWAAAIGKSHAAEPTKVFTVAQYNSPFEFSGRVNEIWLTFEI
ncbi:heme-binding protein 2-like [Impatiens glandulifera]|uniref:heme-binding protein 2-like n=1 Tax=Impatiens glandulifera TaxID=253017 RepID=UPI001FB053B6|nr:heme-binding protein 2-like [Impatiens glandulifera]